MAAQLGRSDDAMAHALPRQGDAPLFHYLFAMRQYGACPAMLPYYAAADSGLAAAGRQLRGDVARSVTPCLLNGALKVGLVGAENHIVAVRGRASRYAPQSMSTCLLCACSILRRTNINAFREMKRLSWSGVSAFFLQMKACDSPLSSIFAILTFFSLMFVPRIARRSTAARYLSR